MEYALGGLLLKLIEISKLVLILVVMEYALGGGQGLPFGCGWMSLNPCCNGICSRSKSKNAWESEHIVS